MQRRSNVSMSPATSENALDSDRILGLAHALRTPLTSMALGLGLLEDGTLGALAPAQAEIIGVLRAELARVEILVAHGLDTDRLGPHAGPIERVKLTLRSLVEKAAGPIAAQGAARGVRVDVEAVGPEQVVADPIKLTWVVASLLGNALRYSPDQSTIRVASRPEVGETLLEVADAGPGLAPEAKDALFDREHGPGLTLHLVREIVLAHGGTLELRSEHGRGTTFEIRLPNPAPEVP
jgi:signal transduction histidine kinase